MKNLVWSVFAIHLLSACSTTGGFEPAREAIKEFSNGASAGKSYIALRNDKLSDSKKLELLQWHTAYIPAYSDYRNSNPDAAEEFDIRRLLQPGDEGGRGPLETLAKQIVCEDLLRSDDGSVVMKTAQQVASNLNQFGYAKSDKTINTLKLLVDTPSPEVLDVKEIANANDVTTKKTNVRNKCRADFDTAKGIPGETAPAAGEIETTPVAASIAAYKALKDLDTKMAAALNEVLSYKRRAEFNKYVDENSDSLRELKTQLDTYAGVLNEKDSDAIRIATMSKYIFAFDRFTASARQAKESTKTSLFDFHMEDLSENKKAQNVIDSANAYRSAKNADPATAIKKLSRSIDKILMLTKDPTPQDIYAQYQAGEAFLDSLSGLADATKDEELSKAISGLLELF